MAEERFTLEGVAYFQQYRKCGKSGCHCQRGQGHGPYWYKRDAHGVVRYVGRTLPDDVAEARAGCERMAFGMMRERRRLRDELDALNGLINHRQLAGQERALLVEMGFGDALVGGGE